MIGFQYGPEGNLFASGAANMQQHGAMAFQQAMQARQAAQLQLQDQAQQNFEATKLQMAQQLQQQRIQGSPSSETYFSKQGSPLTQSIVAAKNLSRTTALAGVPLDDMQKSQLDLLERDPNTPLSTYEGIVNKIKTNADLTAKGKVASDKDAAKQQAENVQQQQKKAAFASASKSLHPDDVGTLQAAVDDPKVTSQQLVADMRLSSKKKDLEATQAVNRQVRGLMSDMQKALKDADMIQAPYKKDYDFAAGSPPATDTEALAAYQAWWNKRKEAEGIQANAQQLRTGGTKGPLPQDVFQQLFQTANGDKDEVRKMALQMGYSL